MIERADNEIIIMNAEQILGWSDTKWQRNTC